MDKMFHVNYSDGLSGLSSGLKPELRACRACLATDTKLYPLSPGLAEAYEYLLGTQHICSFCSALLLKFAAFRERCARARRLMDAAILELQYQPITTDFVRSIDRMSHNLLLEFTLGLDAKVIYLTHQDDDDDDDVNIKENDEQYDDDKAVIDMDDTDGLADVLNDFEEIRNSLNDEVHINFNDNEFNDINEENDSRNRTFNDHVEGLFSGKEMSNLHDLIEKNGFNSKSICNNDIADIINTEFRGKTVIKKSSEESSKMTAVNKEINNTAIVNKNLNVNLPDDINFTDVSINTNDLNENENSNLVDAFNNFILDHDYLDEKFLIETGEADPVKKHIVSKKTDEESLLREIIPKMTKKEKKLVIKEIENNDQVKTTKTKTKLRGALKNIRKHKNKLAKDDTLDEDDSSSLPLTVKDTNDTKELTGDFVKFGDDFNFRIFVLTREEQLEELEKKREGVLYRGAPYKCAMCAKGFRSPATYNNHMKIHDPHSVTRIFNIKTMSHGQVRVGLAHEEFHTIIIEYRRVSLRRVSAPVQRGAAPPASRRRAPPQAVLHALRVRRAHQVVTEPRRVPAACVTLTPVPRGAAPPASRRRAPPQAVLHALRATSLEEQITVGGEKSSSGDHEPEDEALAGLPPGGLTTSEKAMSHYAWHAGRRFPCEHCGETFGALSTALSHVRLRHPSACAACSACGESFVGPRGLRLHMRRAHAAEPKSQELAAWYCFSCRLQFNNQQAFDRHKTVSGCSPHSRACAECGESCASDEALLAHRRLAHAHAHAPVHCPMCDASFASVASRETHYERVHLNVRGRKQDSAVRVKSAARPNLEKRKVMCEICGNKYHSAAALSYHQRSHSGERPYACARCPKTFALAHSLQAHVRTHTGERPHRCSKCARAFRNANNLARHNNTVHLGHKQCWRCGVCRQWLASAGGLRRHAAAQHHALPWPPNQLA
ncbi:hypothetical protein MSG28_016116 [Choristoneura fumiferana]|uniref:Uncharacterized protein n=1 Tax=Choristoneura fumiferana TaxID=7141 RepID=A0ACC0K5F9_CHOFU|nr:hypothetical protein MSG28_016116 [Choristoneura fumiferana]